jgi:hypothetical protein
MANRERDAKRDTFWRGALKRYAASGLSIRAFCQREQLTESAFYAWRRTIGQRDAEAKRLRQPAFLPVLAVSGRSKGTRSGRLIISHFELSEIRPMAPSVPFVLKGAAWQPSNHHVNPRAFLIASSNA